MPKPQGKIVCTRAATGWLHTRTNNDASMPIFRTPERVETADILVVVFLLGLQILFACLKIRWYRAQAAELLNQHAHAG